MTAPPSLFQPKLANLVDRYACGEVDVEEWSVKELVLTLNGQFPRDIGVFCAFMLNYVRMHEGDAIFLAAGEPHAYVSGDIVECMATSDNVIRAGLTPKLRDVPNLVAGLTYTAAEPKRPPRPALTIQHLCVVPVAQHAVRSSDPGVRSPPCDARREGGGSTHADCGPQCRSCDERAGKRGVGRGRRWT
ncbi:hypothetical protein NM688_g5439 [Phlebia brevispora]|uniref:Uncharacterized protein n=1 Tax=Phlebia brevispora TaxID=194682 RepID=A0ACC1SVA6_9APHY|nr:hypothetical protein NM688_g5439 [Phlebia brevispora]